MYILYDMGNKYKKIILVSNRQNVYNSNFEDPELENAWDLLISDDTMWVSAADSGKLIKYTLEGQKITSFDMPNSESPTGLALALNVSNSLGADAFYIVTEQGKLYAYNPSLLTPIRLLADRSDVGASYKGL